MLQVELYVQGVEEAEKLFTQGLDLKTIESRPGWRILRSSANYDIMLFDRDQHEDEENHWNFSNDLTSGAGVQLVINVTGIEQLHGKIMSLGYSCSALRSPPWGGKDFTLQLKEGYVIRLKQHDSQGAICV